MNNLFILITGYFNTDRDAQAEGRTSSKQSI